MRKNFTLCFVLLNLIIHCTCSAQWEFVPSPLTPQRQEIYFHKNTLMFASDSGLVFTSDGGITWDKPSFGEKFPIKVNSLTSLGDKVFACNDSGIFVSTNYKNWERIFKYIAYNITATDSELLVSGYSSLGFKGYSSIDTGKTWIVNTPLEKVENPVASAGADFYIIGEFIYNGFPSIYKNGVWKILEFDTLNHFQKPVTRSVKIRGNVAVMIFNRNSPSTFAYSGDKGETWKLTNIAKGYMGSLEIIDTMVISADNSLGISLTHDQGATWTKIGAGLAPRDSMPYAVCIAGDLIYATSYGNKLYKRKLSDIKGIIHNGNGALQAPDIKNGIYSWYYRDSLIEGHTSKILQVSKPGLYKVNISFETSAMRVNSTKTISFSYSYNEVITENKSSEKSYSVKIDMADNRLNIATSMPGFKSVNILNSQGQQVENARFNSNTISIPTILLPGIYLVRVTGQEGFKIEKLLVE